MKKHRIQLLGCLALLTSLCYLFSMTAFSQTNNSPTLTKLKVTFITTTNDKDHDTKVEVRIIVNKHDVAALTGWEIAFGDNFDPNYWWELKTVEHPTKEALNTGTFYMTATARGNDHWEFTAKLHADFSDGTQRDWTFEKGDLNSRLSHGASQEWRLAEHIKP